MQIENFRMICANPACPFFALSLCLTFPSRFKDTQHSYSFRREMLHLPSSAASATRLSARSALLSSTQCLSQQIQCRPRHPPCSSPPPGHRRVHTITSPQHPRKCPLKHASFPIHKVPSRLSYHTFAYRSHSPLSTLPLRTSQRK